MNDVVILCVVSFIAGYWFAALIAMYFEKKIHQHYEAKLKKRDERLTRLSNYWSETVKQLTQRK